MKRRMDGWVTKRQREREKGGGGERLEKRESKIGGQPTFQYAFVSAAFDLASSPDILALQYRSIYRCNHSDQPNNHKHKSSIYKQYHSNHITNNRKYHGNHANNQ
ncbi:Hypothetical predicted protein [Octopus vulgaris]|uniref:Uncharacterized protein n=1 Tax=Octopus vulgaris TaxID=6645 RepID=A0AA36BRY6_OCTVU|nr:Hypothetical predicted protein [Octopus vulgaris]